MAIPSEMLEVPDDNLLPIVLDDMGCDGSESNLLKCLPFHNCGPKEVAGVQCLLKGTYVNRILVVVVGNKIVPK